MVHKIEKQHPNGKTRWEGMSFNLKNVWLIATQAYLHDSTKVNNTEFEKFEQKFQEFYIFFVSKNIEISCPAPHKSL